MRQGRHKALTLVACAAALLGAAAPPVIVSHGTRCDARDGRVLIPAGTVLLGEDGEGRPGRKVAVAAFWIDRHEVTNRQFAAFVAATGYRTAAERAGGSAVFVQPTGPVDLDNAGNWWRYRQGADWRHPDGPGSDIAGREDWPVVQVDYEDMPAGPERNCLTRRNGKGQRAATSPARAIRISGPMMAKNTPPPTVGRACFRSAIPALTAMSALPRSAVSKAIASACTTWSAMCGNGPASSGAAAA